ncbi:RagB/SusD family nutrient uptake outer membrane protein [Parapedobacter deserti]|uniref:RagB/SusD family nutrient uptake outer membrane protein n=1 Tax=Parapedobacter deserti TaxID=1912957 RepID=A0ABV7JPE7_9SPHI
MTTNSKLYFLAAMVLLTGCESFLNVKPNQKLATPASIEDLQALLNNSSFLNTRDPAAGEVSADNYYLTQNDWNTLYYESDRRMYTWEKDFIFPEFPNDWSNLYQIVYFSNTVLEQLENMNPADLQFDNVKGQALFFRSKAFLQAAWIWCHSYDESARSSLGIPLRLTTDFNEVSIRSSLHDTYNRIIEDLTLSSSLLPDRSVHPRRPAKAAAFALLANTFLSMGNFSEAKRFADSCLTIKNDLLDFNELDASANYPIPQSNNEIIFESYTPPPSTLSARVAKIDTLLYSQYAENDLRKVIFFVENEDGSHGFKGNFTGGPALFTGTTVGEVYLIRAECAARLGDAEGALADLNTLLNARYDETYFEPFDGQALTGDVLQTILLERRKELLMRGLRWVDLKRLNNEGFGIEIRRNLGDDRYVLPPNDSRYALPIPEDVVNISGMPQNNR